LKIVDTAAAKAYETAGPGYLAYIPGGGLFTSALADLLADATNRFVNMAAPAPPLAQLEYDVIRWLCDVFELPDSSMGILTSGGSIANLSAVVTARTAKLGEDLTLGRIYCSEHVHHSMTKAAMIAGLPQRSIHVVPTTDDFRIELDRLSAAIESDRAAGLQPFMVVGNGGTTSTGTVDPLDAIAEICRENELWFHVDGAYGGFFQLTERGKKRLSGIAKADSITLDPHKGMLLPYGTGSLLVRDKEKLRLAHQVEAHYLQDLEHGNDLPDFADYSPELSRDYRGLRVWLPLQLHGVQAFRDALDEKLDLARLSYEELSATPGLDVPWEPDLSIVPFRPTGASNEEALELQERINAHKRVFLSSTAIDGQMYLRFCILSFRTHRDRIEEAIAIVQKEVAQLGG
jgi:aromatic-L-amino-acid decarboxylase